MNQELTGLPTELTVSIKTEDATYKKKFLLYEEYQMTPYDPVIIRCKKQAIEELANPLDNDDFDIKVRSVMQV